jgi:hypothetical protein
LLQPHKEGYRLKMSERVPNLGARRRRLTLAPRPWAAVHHGETATKVCPAFFAGSGGSDDVWGRTDGERSATSGPCLSVGSTSELRSEFARVTNGSRFWVLDDEVCSDGETNVGEVLVSSGDSQCASSRRSGSDQVPPEAAVSPCSLGAAVSSGATTERRSCGRRERALQATPMQQRSKAGQPWKGPLPPRRSVQVRSLGDLWVEDRRSGRGDSRARLAEWLEGEDGKLPAGASPEAEGTAALRCDPSSNFVAEVRVTSQASGIISRAGMGRKVAQENFRFAGGLGLLFLGGGKPVHLPNRLSHLPSRVCSESAAGAAPMADWRRGGRGDGPATSVRKGASPAGAGCVRVQVLLPAA